ncbi:DUF305 domain-containing protein [Plantactinospora sp. WMMC1484]|uniref:DUF305 domain-containing protein n=1 Tax=Plantactinospora sp. WMMC1484 TaxID=3404122 RepID=UPI003BF51559
MRQAAAVVPAGALLVVALLVGGCAGSAAPPPTIGGTPGGAAPADPGPAANPPGTPGSSSPFNGTDIAWLQLTVAMHERVLPLLDLVPERTTEPAVRQLAARVRDTHRADLVRSRRLLDRSGAPKTNPHEGHDMPGMMTANELNALGTVSDAEFRRLFGQHLREHLEQSVRIAGAEQRAGADRETTALAAAIVRTGTEYLTQLDGLHAE